MEADWKAYGNLYLNYCVYEVKCLDSEWAGDFRVTSSTEDYCHFIFQTVSSQNTQAVQQVMTG